MSDLFPGFALGFGGPSFPLSKKLLDACQSKDRIILYEYDQGTTTDAQIRVMGQRRLKKCVAGVDKDRWLILMRNTMPEVPCYVCQDTAKFIMSNGGLNYSCADYFYCSKECYRQVNGSMDMIMEFQNSPRSGACGYGAVWDAADDVDVDGAGDSDGEDCRTRHLGFFS